MIRKLTIVIYMTTLLMLHYDSSAQNTSLDRTILVRNNVGDVGNMFNFARTLPLPPANDIGSVFLMDEFLKGQVSLKNFDKAVVVDKLNYNLELNSLAFLDEEEKIKIIPNKIIDRFSLVISDSTDFFFHNIDNYKELPVLGKMKLHNGFFQMVCELDSVSLFINWELEIIKPSYNKALNIGERGRQLKPKKQYVLLYRNNLFVGFKTKKKVIEKVFGEKARDVYSFIKKNNIDNNNVDLEKLLGYINAL